MQTVLMAISCIYLLSINLLTITQSISKENIINNIIIEKLSLISLLAIKANITLIIPVNKNNTDNPILNPSDFKISATK